MDNAIKWCNKARKQLKKLPRQYQLLIVDAVEILGNSPAEWRNVVELKNHDYGYRLRVGRYRVLFDFYAEIKIVEIEEVRKRDERTY